MRLRYSQAKLLTAATDDLRFLTLAAPFNPSLLQAKVLRDYQLNLLVRVAQAMSLGFRRILIVLPTGGGKTVLASELIRASTADSLLAWFLVHRKELIDQTSDSFIAAGLDHSFVAAKRDFDREAAIHLCGVGTLVNRLDLVIPPNLIVVDEAHHTVAESWARIMRAYPETYVVGLTATPERLDGKGLDEHFDIIIEGPTVAELISWGYLSPFEYYGPDIPDLTGVPSGGSDFHRTKLAEAMNRPALVGKMVDHYFRLAPGKRGIVFATSVDHSKNLAAAFNSRGIPTAHVDADSATREEDDRAFRRGDLKLMTNVALFDEGYDVPGIEYVGDGAPTKSKVKFRQKAGRALRVIYGKGFNLDTVAGRRAAIVNGPKPFGIIADHAGNALTHGLPDDEYEWSLTGNARRVCSTPDDADPVRQCLGCYRIYPSAMKQCPGCGAQRTPSPREIAQLDGELVKLEREALEAARKARQKAELAACKTFGDFKALAEARGYPDPAKFAHLRMNMKTQYKQRFLRR